MVKSIASYSDIELNPTVSIERYWLNILILVSPFWAATRYLPRINFSAISLAFLSAGLNACWSIGPVFKQQISVIAA
jgi:hypothetical protein